MLKMTNTVQNYAWGSYNALTHLYNIENPDKKPMAELWMGAHPKSSSLVQSANKSDNLCKLHDYIAQNPQKSLGEAVACRFGELPFLFKVLCAAQPLSIQVHPNKTSAEIGFAKENAAGIAFDSRERNYKDPNHKPELVFALTPFLALNGFREIDDIVALLQPIASAHPMIAKFLQHPNIANLSALFIGLLTMHSEQKSQAIGVLKNFLNHQSAEPWDTIRFIANFYPDDNGLFSPLLLNVIQLQPGQAMFLAAETPHAYLYGEALEVMANSDNVLRAGLTSKFIDIPELLANLQIRPCSATSLLLQPTLRDKELFFPIPVDDFAFSIHLLDEQKQTIAPQSAEIIFCMEGKVYLENQQDLLTLSSGESCFISADISSFDIYGQGRIARVYTLLS